MNLKIAVKSITAKAANVIMQFYLFCFYKPVNPSVYVIFKKGNCQEREWGVGWGLMQRQ